MKTSIGTHSSRERGQSTVEFAFMFPIFLGVFLGLVAFSLLFYSYVTLQFAVREGANSLVHNQNQRIDSIKSTVCNSTFAFDRSQLYVLVDPPDTASTSSSQCTNLPSQAAVTNWSAGQPVTVIASYTVPLPTFKVPFFTGGSAVIIAPITINATSQMALP